MCPFDAGHSGVSVLAGVRAYAVAAVTKGRSERMRWRWWRTAEEMATNFAKRHPPQSDAEFLKECGLPDDPSAEQVALAVRRSVASYGMVGAAHIRADHRMPGELEELSGWDSLDFVAWVIELERELGDVRIERVSFDRIPTPFSVRDLTRVVYEWCQRGRTQESVGYVPRAAFGPTVASARPAGTRSRSRSPARPRAPGPRTGAAG